MDAEDQRQRTELHAPVARLGWNGSDNRQRMEPDVGSIPLNCCGGARAAFAVAYADWLKRYLTWQFRKEPRRWGPPQSPLRPARQQGSCRRIMRGLSYCRLLLWPCNFAPSILLSSILQHHLLASRNPGCDIRPTSLDSVLFLSIWLQDEIPRDAGCGSATDLARKTSACTASVALGWDEHVIGSLPSHCLRHC